MGSETSYADDTGAYARDTDYISTRITRGDDEWPVEAGRYRLAAARACPWANRALIARRLYGLDDVISLALAGPTHGEESWTFDLDPGERDPVLDIHLLREAYEARDADAGSGVTVPAIVDVPSGKVVTNDFHQITLDLGQEWAEHHRPGAHDLFPSELRDEILEVADANYRDVNNAVYEAGFATDAGAYREAYDRLFSRLDELEEQLTDRRFLVGETITEADVRLWPTLVRFDAVYHNHFKCNRNKLSEMPALWGYARDLFQTPGFGDTIDFPQIKEHYYGVHRQLNPSGIVPIGPETTGWTTAHDRDQLGGRPFGDGSPPGEVAADEAPDEGANPYWPR
ncbi:glutathione S-transferase C-terminal domain-containing protein [Ilumatobacter sp.]|uniref:glutathione S-transferase C-terminal domain-containing protein n=1 Tax=Ilumatobacter sp. TaxID=1967498 RepID=UPI003B522504